MLFISLVSSAHFQDIPNPENKYFACTGYTEYRKSQSSSPSGETTSWSDVIEPQMAFQFTKNAVVCRYGGERGNYKQSKVYQLENSFVRSNTPKYVSYEYQVINNGIKNTFVIKLYKARPQADYAYIDVYDYAVDNQYIRTKKYKCRPLSLPPLTLKTLSLN